MKNNKAILEGMIPMGSKKTFGIGKNITEKQQDKITKLFEQQEQPPLEDNPRFDNDEEFNSADDLIDESMDCMQEMYGIVDQIMEIQQKWTPDHFEEIIRHLEESTEGMGSEEQLITLILKNIKG